MKTKLAFFAALCGVATLLAVPAAADHHKEGEANKTIVETAAGNPDFSTLVAAVKAADLVDALNGDGPLTVFAPTNAAFNKLPSGTVETLLKPENKEQLQNILKYHVVSGKVMAKDAIGLDGKMAESLGGEKFKVEVKGDKVYVDGAQVVTTDIKCKNGVIHVIDTVMIPGD